MVHILIFNISRYSSLADIKDYYDTSGETNIDIILRDFSSGTTEWSVPEKVVPVLLAVVSIDITYGQCKFIRFLTYAIINSLIVAISTR